MKIPKIVRGVGANLALEATSRIINKFYEHFKNIKNEELEEKIRKYAIKDDTQGTIEEVAKRYSLEGRLSEYTSGIIYDLRKNLAYVKGLIESANNTLDAISYAKAQKSYDLFSKMFFYIPYLSDLAKRIDYISDRVKGYLGPIGSIAHRLERFLELTQDLDKEQIKLIYAAARRTANWLNEEVKKQKGIPISLENIVNLFVPKTAKLEQVKEGVLKVYHGLFSTQKPIYGSDFHNPGYATV